MKREGGPYPSSCRSLARWPPKLGYADRTVIRSQIQIFGVCGKKEIEESELGKAAISVPGGCPLNNYPDEFSAYPQMNVWPFRLNQQRIPPESHLYTTNLLDMH